jgi:hypothetical protein
MIPIVNPTQKIKEIIKKIFKFIKYSNLGKRKKIANT